MLYIGTQLANQLNQVNSQGLIGKSTLLTNINNNNSSVSHLANPNGENSTMAMIEKELADMSMYSTAYTTDVENLFNTESNLNATKIFNKSRLFAQVYAGQARANGNNIDAIKLTGQKTMLDKAMNSYSKIYPEEYVLETEYNLQNDFKKSQKQAAIWQQKYNISDETLKSFSLNGHGVYELINGKGAYELINKDLAIPALSPENLNELKSITRLVTTNPIYNDQRLIPEPNHNDLAVLTQTEVDGGSVMQEYMTSQDEMKAELIAEIRKTFNESSELRKEISGIKQLLSFKKTLTMDTGNPKM